jgi:ubiquinone biosynthesis protein COQ4
MTASTSFQSPIPAGLDQPLEITPPTKNHGMHWREVLRLLRDVRSAEDPVEAGLQLFEAVGGMGGERTFQRFVRQPEGRRMLRTRPDLVSRLADRELLAALPEGSLGRAYLAFAEENGFTADGLVEKNKSIDRARDGDLDDHRDWFWDRFTAAHDLHHILTGCPTTGDGETTLLAFSYAQTPQRGYLILLALVTFTNTGPAGHRLRWRAFRQGRSAASLIAAPWEELLAWPLDVVRRCFRVQELMP